MCFLLFYHLKLRCFVVIELKARDFEPGDVSQLSMYQNVVNDLLRHPDDNPTIGLLLVKEKNRTVVEYSLSGYTNPIGVADWQNELSAVMPDNPMSSLPTVEEIVVLLKQLVVPAAGFPLDPILSIMLILDILYLGN